MGLRFRKITENDLEMILKWRTRPEITRYMYTDIPYDMQNQTEWFGKIRNDVSRRDWIVQADGTDAGVVSIYKIDYTNYKCEWGFYMDPSAAKGKGVGNHVALNIQDYVFEKLGLHKLCGEIMADNTLVVKWHQLLGATLEGKRKQHIFKNGQFHDVIVSGLLKKDWEDKIKNKLDYIRGVFE